MQFDVSGFERLRLRLAATEEQMNEAFQNASELFLSQAHATIEAVLLKAAANAGEEAFPIAYIEPMLSAARRIIISSPADIVIDFEELGTPDDLQEGYHYGAKIDGGGQVDLPYGGEPLKNDTEKRYEAWLRVFHGETWHGINYAGAWNETIAARLEAWGDRAPQWLLLQYGQMEYEPIIFPYPVVEEITYELEQFFESVLNLEISSIVARFNKG